MALTKAGKFVLIVVPAVALIMGGKYFFDKGVIFSKTSYKSMKIEGVDLPTAPANAKTTVPPL